MQPRNVGLESKYLPPSPPQSVSGDAEQEEVGDTNQVTLSSKFRNIKLEPLYPQEGFSAGRDGQESRMAMGRRALQVAENLVRQLRRLFGPE